MLYVTGDTHGMIDIEHVVNWEKTTKLSKDDYLIIAGDVCVPPFHGIHPDRNAQNILDKLKCKVLFIDGNHENFEDLNKYEVTEWNGGKVHIISDNITHLMRGQIYEIEGKTIFTMGGAVSPDRNRRIYGLTWFSEEDVSMKDTEEALNNLEKYNYKVDYIITHTIGAEYIYRKLKGKGVATPDNMWFHGSIDNFLDYLLEKVEFRTWYFGHYHMDRSFRKPHIEALYKRVLKIPK